MKGDPSRQPDPPILVRCSLPTSVPFTGRHVPVLTSGPQDLPRTGATATCRQGWSQVDYVMPCPISGRGECPKDPVVTRPLAPEDLPPRSREWGGRTGSDTTGATGDGRGPSRMGTCEPRTGQSWRGRDEKVEAPLSGPDCARRGRRTGRGTLETRDITKGPRR